MCVCVWAQKFQKFMCHSLLVFVDNCGHLTYYANGSEQRKANRLYYAVCCLSGDTEKLNNGPQWTGEKLGWTVLVSSTLHACGPL